jgi:hypothetical protein
MFTDLQPCGRHVNAFHKLANHRKTMVRRSRIALMFIFQLLLRISLRSSSTREADTTISRPMIDCSVRDDISIFAFRYQPCTS